MQPPACSGHEGAKLNKCLEPNSALKELQLTGHHRFRTDCFYLKWKTPVLSECGPADFGGWISHLPNELDSEGPKPLDDAIANLPRRIVGFGLCHNRYPRPQNSQESAPKYSSASTTPDPYPRPQNPMAAQQDPPRDILARLGNFVEKTIWLLCNTCGATEGYVCHLIPFPSSFPMSLLPFLPFLDP